MKKLITLAFATMCTCAVFAQGFYFEMKMSSPKQGNMGTMKVWSQDGNTRSEMNVGTPMGSMDIITLTLKATPKTIYMLSKDKTYAEIDISKSDEYKDDATETYDVTYIGKEKVNGYNTTHVKVKRKSSSVAQDMWTTTELADYAYFMKAKTKFTGQETWKKPCRPRELPAFR